MTFFGKYRKHTPKDPTEAQKEPLELEKGDLPAMCIAALLVFLPVILGISLLYILIAMAFGL